MPKKDAETENRSIFIALKGDVDIQHNHFQSN